MDDLQSSILMMVEIVQGFVYSKPYVDWQMEMDYLSGKRKIKIYSRGEFIFFSKYLTDGIFSILKT